MSRSGPRACGTRPRHCPSAEYVGSLGSWEAFAPVLPTSDEPTGPEALVEEVVDNTTYACSITPYWLTDTPGEIVMYEPNASIMWVGNLMFTISIELPQSPSDMFSDEPTPALLQQQIEAGNP